MADALTRKDYANDAALYDVDGAKIPMEPPLARRVCDSPLRNNQASSFLC